MRTNRTYLALLIALVLAFPSAFCLAQENPQLTSDDEREFLLNAKVIGSKEAGEGITNTYRLTLSDGKITHDASFQSINERSSYKKLERGAEINFADSYLYNLAAYEIAELIGLDDMLPVTVERKWQGKTGSLSWWLPVQMNEGQRREKKINPPNLQTWNNSMYKVRVFTELIYDTDRNNPGNILIGKNWELYMIDFTRAFRLFHNLNHPQELVRCSRDLLQKLRTLDSKAVADKVGKHLNKLELEGVMKRRDKIVAHFDKLIAEKGEGAVLF